MLDPVSVAILDDNDLPTPSTINEYEMILLPNPTRLIPSE